MSISSKNDIAEELRAMEVEKPGQKKFKENKHSQKVLIANQFESLLGFSTDSEQLGKNDYVYITKDKKRLLLIREYGKAVQSSDMGKPITAPSDPTGEIDVLSSDSILTETSIDSVITQPLEPTDDSIITLPKETSDDSLITLPVEFSDDSITTVPKKVSDDPVIGTKGTLDNSLINQPLKSSDESIIITPKDILDDSVIIQLKEISDDSLMIQPLESSDDSIVNKPKEIPDDSLIQSAASSGNSITAGRKTSDFILTSTATTESIKPNLGDLENGYIVDCNICIHNRQETNSFHEIHIQAVCANEVPNHFYINGVKFSKLNPCELFYKP
ncbi:unnamed protein product [Thelazia callipaeda]|uniref:CARDB domain-containing protein n=1 Tax=Thelazia callipaeda TaxID=103827 RepID=A0A0N5CW83_THECL|nr:unnamed protein product [Thelazia callipaeda]